MFGLFGMIREKGFKMISKELLSEVLNLKICIDDTHPYIQSNMLVYDVLNNDEINTNNINIYELAHKCKEWAYKRGFLYWYENSRLFIKIMYSCKVDFEIDIGEYKKPFEIDIDFKACQWLLDNKED